MNSLVLLAILVGALFPLQTCLNARLREPLGGAFPAALVSFGAGMISLIVACFLARIPWPSPTAFRQVPWWAWCGGGMCGAVLVSANVLIAPRLGVATTLMAMLGGQVLGSLALDHFGAFGLTVRPVNVPRIAGVILVSVGIWLVRRF